MTSTLRHVARAVWLELLRCTADLTWAVSGAASTAALTLIASTERLDAHADRLETTWRWEALDQPVTRGGCHAR